MLHFQTRSYAGRATSKGRLKLANHIGRDFGVMRPGARAQRARVLGLEEKKEKRAREGLAYLKTATASSIRSPAYAAANAVDGDPTTYWSSTFADPAWLAVDLGEAHQISRVRIAWETAHSKAFCPAGGARRTKLDRHTQRRQLPRRHKRNPFQPDRGSSWQISD